ncbi:putative transcriptional regulator [Mesorhizobium soli]|uniref:MucR family transcriptional regulator n=1 Tax=Pseudaminobacter soli (ex Li et al. 2025) TaxID=1295366 RepID=UPI002475B4E2|nr:MucR family transcriptional regulator [Mesorhizobium soli]MDH6231892.1 putative transcriptional regulator [Mesorhizobium soli]
MERIVSTADDDALVRLTSDVVSAYISNNAIPATSLPDLIAEIHASLSKLGKETATPAVEAPKPAISVKKSVTDDYLICLEDGKKFKSLKRHIGTHYNLTPDEYRAKWGLPADYPMVAPAYAAARSSLAKKMGLGKKRAENIKASKRGQKATR